MNELPNSDFEVVAEQFSLGRNHQRSELLAQRFRDLNAETIFRYLTEGVDSIRDFKLRFPALFGGQTFMILRQQYYSEKGDYIAEWMTVEESETEVSLIKAANYSDELIIPNEVGKLRGMVLVDQRRSVDAKQKLRAIVVRHILRELESLKGEVPEKFSHLARQYTLPQRTPGNLDAKIKAYLDWSRSKDTDELIESGVHPKIAEKRVENKFEEIKKKSEKSNPEEIERFAKMRARRLQQLYRDIEGFVSEVDRFVALMLYNEQLDDLVPV